MMTPARSLGQEARSRPLTLVVASDREWFVMALEAVLQPHGFRLGHVRSAEELLDAVGERRPDAVLIDDSLPGMPLPELCGKLGRRGLAPSVPVLLYTASMLSNEGTLAAALEAGAWAILPEPMRAARMLAVLRRLLSIGRRMRGLTEASAEAGRTVLSREELERFLPFLEALAERERAELSLVMLGPTRTPGGEVGPEAAVDTVSLVLRHTRRADLCAELEEDQVAVLAYNTPASGTSALVRRLNLLALEAGPEDAGPNRLSAGIVQLFAEGDRSEAEVGAARRRARLSAAELALQEARADGGGVRMAEKS